MEQRIRGHFSEAQCLVVILEKPTTFVVKMAKISSAVRHHSFGPLRRLVAGGVKLKKAVRRNPEKSARASNQRRDPATGRSPGLPPAWWCAGPPPPRPAWRASFQLSPRDSRGSPPIPVAQRGTSSIWFNLSALPDSLYVLDFFFVAVELDECS
jgi:hypothetical protein